MFKFETKFRYFRLNNSKTNNHGPFSVIWYVLDDDGQEEDARCFKDLNELKQFENYTVNNTLNFPENGKDYSPCTDDETPYCGLLAATTSVAFPTKIVLRKTPQKSVAGISECMDIILTDQNGEDKHFYNLEFDVVGVIQS